MAIRRPRPEGEYGFHGVYREIDAPERVVFTEISTRSRMPARS